VKGQARTHNLTPEQVSELTLIMASRAHDSTWRFGKDISAWMERHMGQNYFPTDQKHIRQRREYLLWRYASHREHALHRMPQLMEFRKQDAAYHVLQSLDCKCEGHAELDGIALPSKHILWSWFVPPVAWGCLCRITCASSQATIQRRCPTGRFLTGRQSSEIEMHIERTAALDAGFVGEQIPSLAAAVDAVAAGKFAEMW